MACLATRHSQADARSASAPARTEQLGGQRLGDPLLAAVVGLAAVRAGLIARWMGPVTAVGGGALIVAAMPAVPVVQGSAWLAVGAVGFVIWMLFLAVTGAALLRREHPAAPKRP